MDYETVVNSLRAPRIGRAKPNLMAESLMSQPMSPEPYIGMPNQQEPGLEAVSPEDFIPNPKALAATLAKGGALAAGITSHEALREARKYAASLRGKEREAVAHYTNTESPWHAGELNYALRKGLPIPPDAQEYISTLTNVLKKSPKSDTPFHIHRGMPREVSFSGKADPGFMSVTIDRDVARAYAETIMDNAGNVNDKTGRPKGVPVRLLAPKGSPMVDPDVDQFWDDSELLMPRGTKILHGDGDLAELILGRFD